MSATVRHNSDTSNPHPFTQHSASSLRGKLSQTDDTRALLTQALKTDKDDLPLPTLEPHWAAAIEIATD